MAKVAPESQVVHKYEDPGFPQPVLELVQVSLVRGGRRILKGVDFGIHAGEAWGILGAEGAGKTSLLKVIAGLMRPSEGMVLVHGVVLPPGKLFEGMGVLLEESRVYPWLSVRDNLLLAARGREEHIARIDETLALVELASRAQDKIRVCSPGIGQKLAIARVLLSDPAVVLLDEPANGLDSEDMDWLRRLLDALQQRGTAVVITSRVPVEIWRTCHMVAVMAEGRLVIAGETADILSMYRTS